MGPVVQILMLVRPAVPVSGLQPVLVPVLEQAQVLVVPLARTLHTCWMRSECPCTPDALPP